jgi:hypothetical protein
MRILGQRHCSRTPDPGGAHRRRYDLLESALFNLPMPGRVHGKVYPVWLAEHRGRTIAIASPVEIAHTIDILGRRSLPVTRELGKPCRAVGSHWLSPLHSRWKAWKVREEQVKRLNAAPQA